MCLFPRFIKNKRYQSYKIKKGDVPIDDYRKEYVAIGCGNCYECRKQKAQQWRVRLLEEMKVQKHAYFITLTFSNESLKELTKKYKTTECNGIAVAAVRLFLERWRKKFGKSVKHWLITELGHENTERIHLHGILFPTFPINNEIIQNLWKYGKSDIGEYCNERTINYIVKYVTKIDFDHKTFKAQIICSAGLGESFIHTIGAKLTYKYKPKQSAEYYTLNNGNKVALPIYYRNKLYNKEERDKMWTDRLDKGTIYVNGIPIKAVYKEENKREYLNLLKEMQEWNNNLGYGNTSEEWKEEPYNITFKMLQKAQKK